MSGDDETFGECDNRYCSICHPSRHAAASPVPPSAPSHEHRCALGISDQGYFCASRGYCRCECGAINRHRKIDGPWENPPPAPSAVQEKAPSITVEYPDIVTAPAIPRTTINPPAAAPVEGAIPTGPTDIGAYAMRLALEQPERIASLESENARLARWYERAKETVEAIEARAVAWESVAHHAIHCVECGQTSIENCFEGKELFDAATALTPPKGEDTING
jgi:hypothetical protein